jgi:uncharacterized protein (UPF0264 family)
MPDKDKTPKTESHAPLSGVVESFDWINLELSETEKNHIEAMKRVSEDVKNIHQLTMIPKEYFGRK